MKKWIKRFGQLFDGDVLFRAKFRQYFGLDFDFNQKDLTDGFFQDVIKGISDADLRDFYLEFKRALAAKKDPFVRSYPSVLGLIEAEMLKRSNAVRDTWITRLNIAKAKEGTSPNRVHLADFLAVKVLSNEVVWPLATGDDQECECANVVDFVICLQYGKEKLFFPPCRMVIGKYIPLSNSAIENTVLSLLEPTTSVEEFVNGCTATEPQDVTDTPLQTLAVWCLRHQLIF